MFKENNEQYLNSKDKPEWVEESTLEKTYQFFETNGRAYSKYNKQSITKFDDHAPKPYILAHLIAGVGVCGFMSLEGSVWCIILLKQGEPIIAVLFSAMFALINLIIVTKTIKNYRKYRKNAANKSLKNKTETSPKTTNNNHNQTPNLGPEPNHRQQ